MKVVLHKRIFRNPSFMTATIHVGTATMNLGEDFAGIRALCSVLPKISDIEELEITCKEIDGDSVIVTQHDTWKKGVKQ